MSNLEENIDSTNESLRNLEPEMTINSPELGIADEQHDASNLDDVEIDEDIIPTAIVIKNIPFAIKREQLLDIMAKMDLPLPYAFNYHFDNGVFRGLAFANFTTTDETTRVIECLNGKEIGGRKLRVEYKKMLPQAERERIEREKRGKRGQLEEQHRSTSNLSLSSMGKGSANPLTSSAFTSQLFSTFVNGTNNAQVQQQQAQTQPQPLLSAQNTANSYHSQSQQSQQFGQIQSQQPQQQQQLSKSTERYYAPLPSSSILPPQQLDFNDPDTLEIYSQLLLFKNKEQNYHELAYPSGLSASHKRIINVLCSYLNLVEVYDPTFIIIKRKVMDHASLQNHLQQQGQMTMMHSLQANSTGGSMNRSQSYTSLLQAHAASTVAAAQASSTQTNPITQSALMNTGIGLNANNHSPLTNAPPQSLTPVQHMQHRHQHSTNSISSTNSQLLQSDQSQLQQSPQAFLNQPTVNRTSSRIPSGYSSNQMQLNATNPLLRNVGICLLYTSRCV